MKFTDKAAYDAAAEGIVLLKNERNIFPLTDKVNKVLVTGTGSENLVTCGEGSAGVVTDRNTSFSYELAQIMGENRVSVNPSVTGRVKGEGEIFIVVASLTGMEGNDRINMKLDSCTERTCT